MPIMQEDKKLAQHFLESHFIHFSDNKKDKNRKKKAQNQLLLNKSVITREKFTGIF